MTLEIRFFGLQRSGNHAVINWIISQYPEKKVCFLNNIYHGDRNPYDQPGQAFAYGVEGLPDGKNLKFDIEPLESVQKDVLIYSYEDDAARLMKDKNSFLESVYCKEFEQNRETYFGFSNHRKDILILRDPYNFFASRIKSLQKRTGIKDVDTIIAFWKELAREAIRIENSQDESRIFVSYNRWFSDREYRKMLSEKLGGVEFSDKSLKKISGIGKGSSFDGTKNDQSFTIDYLISRWYRIFDPRVFLRVNKYLNGFFGARKMKVMERWKDMEHDAEMKKVFEDKELQELSMRLFGKVI